jgi:hypothetical protein
MDTDTMDHLTGSLHELHMKDAYHGQDNVHNSNGVGMHICHIGQCTLSTPSSKPFHLKNALHVHEGTLSLVSVPNPPFDNNVFIEFRPYYFFVKNLYMRETILEVH